LDNKDRGSPRGSCLVRGDLHSTSDSHKLRTSLEIRFVRSEIPPLNLEGAIDFTQPAIKA